MGSGMSDYHWHLRRIGDALWILVMLAVVDIARHFV